MRSFIAWLRRVKWVHCALAFIAGTIGWLVAMWVIRFLGGSMQDICIAGLVIYATALVVVGGFGVDD